MDLAGAYTSWCGFGYIMGASLDLVGASRYDRIICG